jgi:hypothetical protein
VSPGFATSTAGQNALTNFDRMVAQAEETESRNAYNMFDTSAQNRSRFTNTLELQPGDISRMDLSQLAALYGQQQNQALQAELANAGFQNQANQVNANTQSQYDMARYNNKAQNARALTQTGGQLAGMAMSPLYYKAIQDMLASRSARP